MKAVFDRARSMALPTRSLPSAPARLFRRRVMLAAVASVTSVAIAASQVVSAATLRLNAEINGNWRGAYDILVRPPAARLDLERTGGLVEPNFLALAGHGGISSSQVAQIRAIAGVEIAAPIGWVGFMSTPTTSPSIEVTKFPDQPTLYSASLTVSTFDGLSSHLVFQDSLRILLAKGDPNTGPIAFSDYGSAVTGPLPDGSQVADLGTAHAPPQLESPILAVDPIAERALLGAQGSFLDALARLNDRDDLTVGNADPGMVLPGYNARLDIAGMQRIESERSRPVIPILVSRSTYAPIEITLEVSQIGHSIANAPDDSDPRAALDAAQRQAGSGLTPVGTSVADVSDTMRPFRLNGVAVPWPGTELTGTGAMVQVQNVAAFTAGLTDRPSYSSSSAPDGSSTLAFRITPRGLVPPGGPGADQVVSGGLQGSPESTRAGTEQSYRGYSSAPIPVAQSYTSAGRGDPPFVLAPIAEYDLNTLQLPRDPLDYVPYGAYDLPDTTLIAGPDGRPTEARSMSPTLNPAGLLQVPPLGIVDIHAAELLRGSAPIDAVRVRVAGIVKYDASAVTEIERVAAAISAMGLDVDIVAASSPQAVDVYVPEYETATSPATDLGWIQQHWTTLGAAPQVDRALGATNIVLLLLALAGVVVVILGTQLLLASVRMREAAILAALGWRRRAIVRWQASESAVAGGIVFGFGLLAWLVAGRESIGLAIALAGGVLFAVSGLAAALLAAPAPGRMARGDVVVPHGPLRMAVGGIGSYAVRSLIARPWRSLTMIVGLAVAASTIAPAAAVLVSAASRAGPTLLASALSERLSGYQLALLGLTGFATLAFTLLTLRVDYVARATEMHVLDAAGWRPAEIGRMLFWSRVGLAVPASILAAALSVLTTGPIVGPSVPVAGVVLLAVGFALSTVWWGGLARLRTVAW
ncbi:MAG: hypothetical protein ACHQ15_01510 [Candidatus Limnocylindrales bacterium]